MVVTVKPHIYAGVRRFPGDEYEITGAGDLRLYKALGWVADKPPAAAPALFVPAPIVEPGADLAPAYSWGARTVPAKKVAAKTEKASERRAYKRKDLQAE